MRKRLRFLLIAILSLAGLILILVTASALSNLGLPQHSTVVETLSQADKIRLAEVQHLRRTVGDAVWPGWGQADIPVITYNEAYAFLARLSKSACKAGSRCRRAFSGADPGR